VSVRIVKENPRYDIAECVAVSQPSANRVTPNCIHVAEGCGGCDWQHIESKFQTTLKQTIVTECLERLAKIKAPEIASAAALPSFRYRTTVKVAVQDSKAAFHQWHSPDLVGAEGCQTAHPLVQELLDEGRFGLNDEVTIRAGSATGDRIVVTNRDTNINVPDDVKVISIPQLKEGKRLWFYEVVNSTTFRVSALSFFQNRPDGAAVLADIINGYLDQDGPLLDAYCGVGLFGVLCGQGRLVTGIESSPSSAADARINLERGSIVRSRFENWKAKQHKVAIADPARTGLKAETRGCSPTWTTLLIRLLWWTCFLKRHILRL
jgi:23S rRNA (uracil1939-C5)-methyltransferase